MAKQLSSRSVLIRAFHHIASKPSTSVNSTGSGISHFLANNPKVVQNPTLSSWLLNSQRSNFSSSAAARGKLCSQSASLPRRNNLGIRYFSLGGMGSKDFAKKVVKNPGLAFKGAFARYKDAVILQIEAFWKRNYVVVLGAGGFVVCMLLWRVLFGVANTFIGFSQGMAKYGFLALSSAIVAFAVSCSFLVLVLCFRCYWCLVNDLMVKKRYFGVIDFKLIELISGCIIAKVASLGPCTKG